MTGATGCIIHMRNVVGTDNKRALDAPLPLLLPDGSMGEVPVNFEWDGASVPLAFQWMYPRHNHPIASCRHDYGCKIAKNAEERKFFDERFQIDTATTSWWITKKVGYIGVRIGALLGIGCRYKENENEDVNRARGNAGY